MLCQPCLRWLAKNELFLLNNLTGAFEVFSNLRRFLEIRCLANG